MKLILAAITMAALWGCSNSSSPVDPNRREDPDIVDPDTLPAFVQNDDEWTGFYKEDGYEDRKEIYNLYHFLNHLNIFGPKYLMPIKKTILRYA